MQDLGKYYAHSRNKSGREDFVRLHLADVALRAAEYAAAFQASEEARLAGMLHDIGKYGSLFQKRLMGKTQGIDHWSAGAWIALMKYKQEGIATALAIQGHHIGLQKGDKDSLCELDLKHLNAMHPLGLNLSEKDINVLLHHLSVDGIQLPEISRSVYDYTSRGQMQVAAMFDVRMIFSTLVDADFIETEAHFDAGPDGTKRYRVPGLFLDPEKALQVLLDYIDHLAINVNASDSVKQLRADLLDTCLASADSKPGLFTLTAPTGAGKTFSMLAFALKHALKHGLRRIVTVIPYLSIIEQTVREYRKAFASLFDEEYLERYILEHHSLSGTRAGEKGKCLAELGAEETAARQTRLLAQNWDAPIIVTTSVQFLESLFANRPSACRKLHRLARCVILLDEVQTIPVQLAIPTLATLSHLAARYGSTIVFATATQPAFSHLDKFVRMYCRHGWKPKEIVRPELKLFERAKRTRVSWPQADQKIKWIDLAMQLSTYDQVLCVVNLKRHAILLFDLLHALRIEGLFHLSTNMCPAHRRVVLEDIYHRLEKQMPCRLVSTQCIEAGVDVDFPVVYRALGPMDSIAQAAGRCNRNGHAQVGTVHVFVPEEEEASAYPDGIYGQAAAVSHVFLSKYGASYMDIHTPTLFEEYYRELYNLTKPEQRKEKLYDAIKREDFIETAQGYRVIAKDTINVLVPYDGEVFEQITTEARQKGITRQWIAKARPYTVGLFRPKRGAPIEIYLDPVPVSTGIRSEDWYIYLNKEHYDTQKGLNPPVSVECLIA